MNIMADFVWYDLMTNDVAQAAAFYRAVVAWESRDSGVPGQAYTLFEIGTDLAAGLLQITPEDAAIGMRPCWTGYIGVTDVDAYAAKVQTAGGRMYKAPEDIPGVGRFAVVADPQEAVFLLFSPADTAQRPTAAAMGANGRVGWHELRTSDPAAAFAFYEHVFGWTKGEALDIGEDGVYQQFITDSMPIGGIMQNLTGAPRPFWLYYIFVPEIDAAMQRIQDNGGRVINGPHEVPGGAWVIQAIDPQGAHFALVAGSR